MTTQLRLAVLALVVGSTSLLHAQKNLADYPLRIHIFNRSETTFYHHRVEDEAKGEGRANLYENGEPKGIDFSFDCSEKLKASFGYETYPARWKKQDKELRVLLPVFGKAGSYFTCDLKTDVKDMAYATRNGHLEEEPRATFKAWMIKHDYDPEHGKNEPTRATPATSAPAAPPPTA
jgi:hypothetical protein